MKALEKQRLYAPTFLKTIKSPAASFQLKPFFIMSFSRQVQPVMVKSFSIFWMPPPLNPHAMAVLYSSVETTSAATLCFLISARTRGCEFVLKGIGQLEIPKTCSKFLSEAFNVPPELLRIKSIAP